MSIEFSLLSFANAAAIEQWDAFVNVHAKATPYHLSAWGKAVQSAYGFHPEYWIAKEHEHIVAICPSVQMRSLRAKKTICSLPYCDIGGILAVDQSSKHAMLKQLIKHSAEQGIASLELRETHQPLVLPEQAPLGEKVRMLLSLPDSAEALMAQFKSKLRSQIRKAEKNGLSANIFNLNDVNDTVLNEFYAIIAANMRQLGSPVHSKAWYQAIVKTYAQNMYLCLVYFDKTAVGAALVLKTDKKAVIPWASTRAEYNRLAPNMLLYWSVLSEAAEQGLDEFDFGRSTVGEGTFNFKKQWGCFAQTLHWQHYYDGSIQPAEHLNTSSTRELVASIWQRLPLSMSNTIGPKVRKYISL